MRLTLTLAVLLPACITTTLPSGDRLSPTERGSDGVLGTCDPNHVIDGGDHIHVLPHDWSQDEGDTYTWYDLADLDRWILYGTPGDPGSLDFASALTPHDYPWRSTACRRCSRRPTGCLTSS